MVSMFIQISSTHVFEEYRSYGQVILVNILSQNNNNKKQIKQNQLSLMRVKHKVLLHLLYNFQIKLEFRTIVGLVFWNLQG